MPGPPAHPTRLCALPVHVQVAVVHGDLPVVQRLVQEVGAVSQAMLEQLLQRVQVNIQLPECLRVIGYLRRLASFTGGRRWAGRAAGTRW